MIEELRRRVEHLQETHRAEAEALRGESGRRSKEAEDAAAAALEKAASDREAAVAAVDRKLLVATEELERLRGRLESVPGEVRAVLEREFQERERLVRDGVRAEVREG
ncbi:MAG: hypothetical protein AAF368_07290 [Planctomycetota bacterium]